MLVGELIFLIFVWLDIEYNNTIKFSAYDLQSSDATTRDDFITFMHTVSIYAQTALSDRFHTAVFPHHVERSCSLLLAWSFRETTTAVYLGLESAIRFNEIYEIYTINNLVTEDGRQNSDTEST